jgi:hypothetical protein
VDQSKTRYEWMVQTHGYQSKSKDHKNFDFFHQLVV